MNRNILIVAGITLFLDQITKAFIPMYLKLNEEFVLIKDFFSIHYIQNYGAAWNILNNKIPMIIILSFIALILLYHFMYTFKPCARNNLAFGMAVGGIVGNLMDRWLFGYVRDFLDFQIFHYDYPVFNIADIGVVIGICLLIYAVMKGEDHYEKMDRLPK